jgi:hypothetical protein
MKFGTWRMWGVGDRVGGVDWFRVAEDRDQWWALVNTTMNIRIT